MKGKKIAVITGASSGIGEEFVRQLVAGGDHFDELWLIARRRNRLEELKRRYIGQEIRIFEWDLEKENSWETYKKQLELEKPRIACLVNAAGYGIIGKTMEIDLKDQIGMLRLNCEALLAMTNASLPYCRRGSKIFEIASGAAFFPQPGFNVYAASKSFVLSYARALGRELKKQGITIIVVCPGPVKTEFFDRAESLHKSKAYKKLFRVSKEKVVSKAWKDAKRKKSVSVYGIPMNLLWILSKLLPNELILKGF